MSSGNTVMHCGGVRYDNKKEILWSKMSSSSKWLTPRSEQNWRTELNITFKKPQNYPNMPRIVYWVLYSTCHAEISYLYVAHGYEVTRRRFCDLDFDIDSPPIDCSDIMKHPQLITATLASQWMTLSRQDVHRSRTYKICFIAQESHW